MTDHAHHQVLVPKSNDPMETEIIHLIQEHQAENSPNTLVLYDPSHDEKSLHLFQHNAGFVILDAYTNLHQRYFIKQHSVPIICEEARHRLAYAMIHGKTLILRLGNAAVDFIGLFNDDVVKGRTEKNPFPPFQEWHQLPHGFMLNNGENVKHNPPHFPTSLLRKEDFEELRHEGLTSPRDVHCHPSFRLVITSTIPPDRMEELLFNGKHGLPGTMDCYDIKTLAHA
jgi:hypothetical protein